MIIFIVGRIASSLFTSFIGSLLTKSKVDETLVKFAKNIAYFSFMAFVVLAALEKLGYDDDLKKVKATLVDVLSKEERILEDPEPTIGLLELGDNSVNFAVRPWVNTSDYWPVLFAVQEAIKLRFDAEGISIPYPQRDIHSFKCERTVFSACLTKTKL